MKVSAYSPEQKALENTHVYAPKFLDSVKRDHFLEKIIPVVAFSRGWLREPETPFVHQWVLDVEVVDIVKDSLDLVGRGS